MNAVEMGQVGEKLPKGWKKVMLCEIGKIVSGGTPSRGNPPYFIGEIPWVKTLDLNCSVVRKTEERISEEAFEAIRGELLPIGTVMVAMYGGGGKIGKSGILGIEATTNQAVCSILPNPKLFIPEYLHFWMVWIRPQWMLYSGGNRKDPNINKGIVERMKILLPPLPEQKRIVGILSDRLTAIDKARTSTEAQLKAAKALPAAYLREVFDSPEAQNSKKKPLRSVCEFVGGMQPPKSTFQYKPIPGYVRLVQIQDFRRSDVAVYIPKEEAKRKFDETDVMIGRYGPPVFQILRGLSGAYNVALMKTVPKEGLLKDYLYYLLQEPGIQNAVISQSQRSAGQSGVQKEFLEEFKVVVPSINKQQKIVEILSNRVSTARDLQQSLQSKLTTINQLPAAILRQAFNGEL